MQFSNSQIRQVGAGLGARLALGLMTLIWALSVTGCSWIDARQRAAMYRPDQSLAQAFHGLQAGDQQLYLLLNQTDAAPQDTRPARQNDGSQPPYLGLWWLPAAKADAPTLLYFHGVFRNLSHNYPKLLALREAGFNVLAVSYRGWPWSSALLPSEQSIDQDAARAVAELMRREPDPHKRLLYGHSLGGAVAVVQAARLRFPQDYAGLMLESSFTSLAEVGESQRWYAFLLRPLQTQYFDSLARIGQIRAPLLVRHGDADRTVPFALGQKLFDAAVNAGPPRRFIDFEGGTHSDLHVEFPARYRSTAWDFWREVQAAQQAVLPFAKGQVDAAR